MKPTSQKSNPLSKVNPASKSISQVSSNEKTSNVARPKTINNKTSVTQSNSDPINLPKVNNEENLKSNTKGISQNPSKKYVNEGKGNLSNKNQSNLKGQNVNNNNIQKKAVQDQIDEETKVDSINQIDNQNQLKSDVTQPRNDESLESFSQYSNPLIQKFFEIIGDKISFKIASFLPITDLITLACLSNQARKLVPIVMSENHDKFFKIIEIQQHNSSDEFEEISQFHRLKEAYFNLISKSLPAIEQIFQNLQQQKIPFLDVVLEILAVGVSYSSNIMKQKSNVAEYIKEKGILKTFSSFNLNYVTPVKQKMTLPQYPNLINNDFGKFVKLIHKYAEYKQSNKFSVEKQKKDYQQISLYQQRQNYVKIASKVLPFYKKPILRMRKGNQIFDFVNKNTISIMIQFLKIYEIVCLIMSGKQMRIMIHQILEDHLISMKNIRESKLREAGISSELASAIIKSKHLKLFDDENHYKMIEKYDSPTFKKMIIAMSKATSSFNELDEKVFINPNRLVFLNFRFSIPIPERIIIFNDFIQTYPTLASFKEQLIQQKLNSETVRDCILLYQSMQGFIGLVKLNQNNQSWKKIEEDYNKHLFSFDAKIHYFEKLIGKNEEDLFIFFKKRICRVFCGKSGVRYVTTLQD